MTVDTITYKFIFRDLFGNYFDVFGYLIYNNITEKFHAFCTKRITLSLVYRFYKDDINIYRVSLLNLKKIRCELLLENSRGSFSH